MVPARLPSIARNPSRIDVSVWFNCVTCGAMYAGSHLDGAQAEANLREIVDGPDEPRRRAADLLELTDDGTHEQRQRDEQRGDADERDAHQHGKGVHRVAPRRPADHTGRAMRACTGVLLDGADRAGGPHSRIQNLREQMIGPREQRNLDRVVRHLLTRHPDGRRAGFDLLRRVAESASAARATTATTTK